MRFKTFLEASGNWSVSEAYQPISKEKAIQFAKSKCSIAINDNFPRIIRGMRDTGDYLWIEGIRGRRSANTTNEYTTLLDNLPSWRQYPKRSESLICTTTDSNGYPYDFGDVYIILPSNGANIGVCRSFDLWSSFPVLKKELERAKVAPHSENPASIFNEVLREIFSIAGVKLDKKNDNYEILLKAISDTNDWLKTKGKEHRANKLDIRTLDFFEPVINGNETLIAYIKRMLDPKANEFKILNYSELGNLTGGRELWTDAPSLAIRLPDENDDPEDVFNALKKEIMGNE